MIVALALIGAVTGTAADSVPYVVLNHGRQAGQMSVVTRGDSIMVHYLHIDRQRGPRVDAVYHLGTDQRPTRVEILAGGAQSAAPPTSEKYELTDSTVRWRVGADSGSVGGAPTTWYRSRSTTPFDDAILARFLLRQPQQSAPLVPAGTVRVTLVADTTLPVGAGRIRLRLAAIDGVDLTPTLVWLDEAGDLAASSAGWFVAVRRGLEPALPALRAIELAFDERRDAALAAQLTRPRERVLLIRNGDVFDSETGRLRLRTSILIEDGTIRRVAPADSIDAPAGATILDATGKTVIPGLWDMHTHAIPGGPNGVLQLAAGITTVRDMASDIDVATSMRTRADQGTMLGPRMVLAGLIEGPGMWAGPSDVLVRTEAEARAWVARYDSLGYRQIKLYNLVHPDLVPAIADEAHRRGMRLSGHVVRGLSVPAAVRIGYDEIQHAAFLLSTFSRTRCTRRGCGPIPRWQRPWRQPSTSTRPR